MDAVKAAKYVCVKEIPRTKITHMRSENSEYLTINSFDCSFNCFMFFNQRNSSFWSNSTQSITVITAQQDAEINELCAVTWTIISHTEANERLVQRKLHR